MILFSALFILFFTTVTHLQVAGKYTGNDSMVECLKKYGLKMDDLEFLRNPSNDQVPKKFKVLEDKVACAFACTFKKESKYRSILPFLRNIIKMENQISVNLRKEMLETLNRCNEEAERNDCKLLQCIKVTRNPFMNLVFSYGS